MLICIFQFIFNEEVLIVIVSDDMTHRDNVIGELSERILGDNLFLVFLNSMQEVEVRRVIVSELDKHIHVVINQDDFIGRCFLDFNLLHSENCISQTI